MRKSIIVTLIVVVSILLGYFFIISNKSSVKVGNYSEELTESIKLISKAWKNADIPGDEICKKAVSTSDIYYQCNPKYLKCVLDNKLIKDLDTVGNLIYQQNHKFKSYSVDIKYPNGRKSVHLIDDCHEVFLPQRHYPFLNANRTVIIEWDNFNKNIFVDKFQARVWEIREWAERNKKEKILEKIEFKSPVQVATGLTIEEMTQYCKSQGKNILSARVYDAMSIYPEDITNPRNQLVRAAFYPWSRLNTKTKIYNFRENPSLDMPDLIRKDICSLVHGEDCGERKYLNYNRKNVSWMGAYELLGGYMEYVRNPINPKENLVLSSMNYPLYSKVHTTGIRGYWDGDGFTLNNFESKKFPIEKKIVELEIAFRCMRYR